MMWLKKISTPYHRKLTQGKLYRVVDFVADMPVIVNDNGKEWFCYSWESSNCWQIINDAPEVIDDDVVEADR